MTESEPTVFTVCANITLATNGKSPLYALLISGAREADGWNDTLRTFLEEWSECREQWPFRGPDVEYLYGIYRQPE